MRISGENLESEAWRLPTVLFRKGETSSTIGKPPSELQSAFPSSFFGVEHPTVGAESVCNRMTICTQQMGISHRARTIHDGDTDGRQIDETHHPRGNGRSVESGTRKFILPPFLPAHEREKEETRTNFTELVRKRSPAALCNDANAKPCSRTCMSTCAGHDSARPAPIITIVPWTWLHVSAFVHPCFPAGIARKDQLANQHGRARPCPIQSTGRAWKSSKFPNQRTGQPMSQPTLDESCIGVVAFRVFRERNKRTHGMEYDQNQNQPRLGIGAKKHD